MEVQPDQTTPMTYKPQRTPLPKMQLCGQQNTRFRYFPYSPTVLLLLVQFCEPVAATVVLPFVFRLVNETGVTQGNEDRTGYYAGIIVRFFLGLSLQHLMIDPGQESTFFLAQTLFVLQWGRLSDKIGRKPVVLIGISGLALSMLCFGLSRSFPAIVASRSLAGLLNGNAGVLKAMMGEITDETNAAQGFSFIPMVWAAGSTLAYVHSPKLEFI